LLLGVEYAHVSWKRRGKAPPNRRMTMDTTAKRADAGEEGAPGEYDDMSEAEFEVLLTQALDVFAEEEDVPGLRINAFSEALPTSSRGLMIRIGDAEFHLAIRRSH
jgi:hypothetical protein